MLRQMMDLYATDYGIRGRITGLRYLNPGNAPDTWEKRQLEAFVRGDKSEVWEVENVAGKPYLRYLRAMRMEPGCDKCHAVLGYKTGDMRGATGLNLPLAPYFKQIEASRFNLGISHLFIWLVGLAGIAWGGWISTRWSAEREASRAELLRHRDHLESLIEERTQQLSQAKESAESAECRSRPGREPGAHQPGGESFAGFVGRRARPVENRGRTAGFGRSAFPGGGALRECRQPARRAGPGQGAVAQARDCAETARHAADR
jgi:hypothetical protein